MKKKLNTKYGRVSVNVRNLGSDRLYVVLPRKRAPQNKAEKDFRKKLPDGAVLISRRDQDKPEKHVYQIYKDGIYSAIRGRSRIRLKYGNEWHGGEVRDIVLNINSAALQLKNLLNYCRLSGAQKKKLKQCLEGLALLLQDKRNFFKERAFDFIDVSSEPEDTLGRVNPSAKCNQLATGMENLNFRLLEIPGIEEFISRDQIFLMRERDQHMFICKELYYQFHGILLRPAMKRPDRHNGENLPKLEAWIEKRIQGFANMNAAPFTKTRRHALRDLAAAREAARGRDYAKVRDNLRKVKNSLRFKEAQFYLEEIILKVALMLDELDLNTNKRNMDWSMGRSCDLGANMEDLRERLHKILDDRGFSFKPKHRLFVHLGEAQDYFYRLELKRAKDELKAASDLI